MDNDGVAPRRDRDHFSSRRFKHAGNDETSRYTRTRLVRTYSYRRPYEHSRQQYIYIYIYTTRPHDTTHHSLSYSVRVCFSVGGRLEEFSYKTESTARTFTTIGLEFVGTLGVSLTYVHHTYSGTFCRDGNYNRYVPNSF